MPIFLGSIQIFAFNFAPVGWLPCQGQLMEIAQNTALYNLLGTTYGGDGNTTFALPNLPPLASGGPAYYICVVGGVFPKQG